MNKHQAVTCGHTQYGGYSVFQRLWLVSAFLHLDSEVASKPRTAHTAVRYKQAEKNNDTMTMRFLLHKDKEEKGKASPQKQVCGCPSLQPSHRNHTHAFLPTFKSNI